ncbi:hypothetical protein cypCar_00002422 [Cyprinus carpio]|nr:hypothetical protein cypCar_00002422 [Cyprinus carpio]
MDTAFSCVLGLWALLYAASSVLFSSRPRDIENVTNKRVTVLYRQKFPNGTFQEVSCVADEMIKLAEKCCKDDASPGCYDKGATEISEKSCGKDSPFPKHPGIEQCCTLQGQERKLCLASLWLSAYYGNLLGLSFEEASAISGRFQSGLEKCCLQPQPECIIEEVRRRVRGGGGGPLDVVFSKPQ